MSDLADHHLESLARQCLSEIGICRTGQAYLYLSDAILLVLDGVQPSRELWERIAHNYGKRAANVRATCRRAIQKAYYASPENFCAALDDIYFTAPKTRDFIVVASKAVPIAKKKRAGVERGLAD